MLCITDHVLRTGSGAHTVDAERFAAYLRAVDREADRAWRRYGLLVIPGLELTYEIPASRDGSGHALAVGLRQHVGVDDGLEPALCAARAAGAALIAAHPHGETPDPVATRTTRGWWHAAARAPHLVDRFELINRHQTFPWVAEHRLPAVAGGDFHREEHVETWKTLLPCRQDERSVVRHLRSSAPAYIAHVGCPETGRKAA